jgi:hypothetical protein
MTTKFPTHESGYPDINGEVILLRERLAAQKTLLDSIARATFGWPDDGTRRTYTPEELPVVIMRLRHYAQKHLKAETDAPFEAEPQGATNAREALASARLDGETHCLPETQGAPPELHCHGCTDDMCPGCCDCRDDAAQKPEGA